MTTTDVSRARAFTTEQLAEIASFEDAALALRDAFGTELEQVSDYGSGFVLEPDKSKLIGVPLIIVQWRENGSDYGDDGNTFVSAELITRAGERLVINDGGSGIARQLRQITAKREAAGRPDAYAGLACPNGLTRTEYYANAKTGETSNTPQRGDGWGPATTYYLAN